MHALKTVDIAIISDTHGAIPEAFEKRIDKCDEIWHAGDIGAYKLLEKLREKKTFKGVYGNIDDQSIRSVLPEYDFYTFMGIKVLITHIGGRPGNYSTFARGKIDALQPDLFICGHSHILKIEFDKKNNFLFINPGAAGREGVHLKRTMVVLTLAMNKTIEAAVIEVSR